VDPVVASKWTRLEVNADTTKYVVMCQDQNAMLLTPNIGG